jgi:hypothetical protein
MFVTEKAHNAVFMDQFHQIYTMYIYIYTLWGSESSFHSTIINIKLIGENMFCMKAHQLSIILPSKSRLVQLRIYTCYTKTCFFLGVTCYFSRMTYFWSIVLFRCNDIPRLDFINSNTYFMLQLSKHFKIW